jgi:transposase InsO family protein
VQIRWIGYRVKGFLAAADRGLYWDMICKSAEQRLNVLRFWEHHGLSATQEAFGVSRRTLYAWQARLRAGAGKPHTLTPGSTRPRRLRRRSWPASLVQEIRRLRMAHPNLGKEKLFHLIAAFCKDRGFKVPSVRTIGRLIADAPDKMRHARLRSSRFHQGRVARSTRERKPKGYRPESPGDCVAWDSIERRLNGIKRHLITCTDLASRFGFALGVTHLSSRQALLAWQVHQTLFPIPVRRVLSDNGQEFAKYFHQALQSQQIVHWHTFPRTPKMNAHCERFNRTVQEEFLDVHEQLLFYDLPLFNQRLLEWIGWFNAVRPHHALALKTPLDILAPYILTSARSAGCTGPMHRLDVHYGVVTLAVWLMSASNGTPARAEEIKRNMALRSKRLDQPFWTKMRASYRIQYIRRTKNDSFFLE